MCPAVCPWQGPVGWDVILQVGYRHKRWLVPSHRGACRFLALSLAGGGARQHTGRVRRAAPVPVGCVPLCPCAWHESSSRSQPGAQGGLFIALPPLCSPAAPCCRMRSLFPSPTRSHKTPAAPGVGKVHLNPFPPQSRKEKGVWRRDGWAMWKRQGQAALGCWVRGKLGGRGTWMYVSGNP